MRTVTAATKAVWESGLYTGDNRPMVRATIQRLSLRTATYGSQVYSSICHGQANVPRELPNVSSLNWARSGDSTVATATIVLFNTAPLPLGTYPADLDVFDLPGWYTPGRGKSFGSPSWSHDYNEWRDWIVPDRIIRTYEGYGFDPSVAPELDPHLYSSGVWMIDDVIFENGLIKVEVRDVGRALIDQVLLPPVVPLASYPLYFEQFHQVDNPDVVSVSGSWVRPSYSWDSNRPNNFTSVYGHTGSDAFDTSTSTYWLSVGNVSPNDGYSFEYIEGKLKSSTITALRFRTWGGPYLAYISVYSNGAWVGTKKVPYDPNNPASAPNGANIKYVTAVKAKKEALTTVKLPKAYANVTKVRVCFTNLYDSGTRPYRYRAGVRMFEVASQVTTTTDGGTHTEPFTSPPGFSDYSDIVKILLAYAGWHWPRETSAGFTTRSDGARVTNNAPTHDSVLQSGRVWGDIELCGTGGVAPLGVDIWDKKPVMDGINYVKDLLGYIFFIDEDGAAVFRSPNIWSVGNWIGNAGSAAGRTTDVITLSDDVAIMNLSAKLSSRSIRERVFVGNLAGQVAATANGMNPNPSGLRRVGGWCVDTETEIFTRRGWLRWNEVVAGDETLSINKDTGLAEWHPIREVAVFDEGPRAMLEMHSNKFSALTTPNHRWLVERLNSGTGERQLVYTTSEAMTNMDRVPRTARRSDVPVEAKWSDEVVELVAWAYTRARSRARGTSLSRRVRAPIRRSARRSAAL